MAFDGNLHVSEAPSKGTNDGQSANWPMEDRIPPRVPKTEHQAPRAGPAASCATTPVDSDHPLKSLKFADPHSMEHAEGAAASADFDRFSRRMFNEAWRQDQVHKGDKGYHSAVDALIDKINKDVKSQYFTLRREGPNYVGFVDSREPVDKHGNRAARNKDNLTRYDAHEYEWGHPQGK
jgi:hypothetical protein